MKIILGKDIRSLNISPRICVEWIRESFSLKKYSQLPAKISVHPQETDFFTSMPCLLPYDRDNNIRYFGIKEVHKIEGAEPSLGSDLLLYDAIKGELLALMDADWITTMRTGAVAALTAKVLRRKDSKSYGIIGLGNTARAFLLCLLESEPDTHINVKLLQYKNQADLFMQRFDDYENVTFQVVDDIIELTGTVDVLVSCITSAHGLLVEDVNLFPEGITVIPIHMRGFQNCDTVFDRVFGDDTDHVKGFKYFNQFKKYNEIGEVLAGHDTGRENEKQRIIAYNYGLGLHDVVFASKIFEMSQKTCLAEIDINKETKKFWI